MRSDYEAMQQVIARDGASVISGATEDLRAIRRCQVRPFTPENMVTVTLDETYRIANDLTLARIGHDRGWLVNRSGDLELTPVRDFDGTYYRLDRHGNRHQIHVERRK